MSRIVEMFVVNMLLWREGKILLLRRKDDNPMWDKCWHFPGGKIEEGEDRFLALHREVKEETGVSLACRPEFLETVSYDWKMPDGSIRRCHVHCYRGKTDVDDISIEEGKADQYLWADPKEIASLRVLDSMGGILDRWVTNGPPLL